MLPRPPVLKQLLCLALALPGPMALAQITVTAQPTPVVSGHCAIMKARRQDDLPNSKWSWTLSNPKDGHLVTTGKGQIFVAPQVDGPRTIPITVTDLTHGGAVTALLPVEPPLTLKVSGLELYSGGEGEITAFRGLVPLESPPSEPAWHWKVLEDRGTVNGPPEVLSHPGLIRREGNRVFVKAPRVEGPSLFRIQCLAVKDPDDRGEVVLAVRPQVEITFLDRLKQTLLAGSSCKLKVRRADDMDDVGTTWRWNVLETGEELPALANGEVTYTAPEASKVMAPITFHLQATDLAHPAASATIPIHVMPLIKGLPPATASLLFETIMTRAMGQGWMAPTPAMTPFAGFPAAEAPERPTDLHTPWALGFVDDPAMAPQHLYGQWLVGDQAGLAVVSYLGETIRRLPVVHGFVTALAVRPAGTSAEPPVHVVFAQRDPLLGGSASEPVPGYNYVIRTLEPDGTCRTLAGRFHDSFRRAAPLEGPALDTRFGRIGGLAVGRDGTVFVADTGNRLLRMIGTDGQVRTLAGNRSSIGFRDGKGAEAGFVSPSGLTLDPHTHTLYVSDHHAIRKVALGGAEAEVSTLLGGPRAGGADLIGPAEQQQPAQPGQPCLNQPQGLEVHGDTLFIADSGHHAIRSFNLKTGVLATLAGDPGEPTTRMGPLRLFSPALPPGSCAALFSPRSLSINPDGICLVIQSDALVQLDLHTLAASSEAGTSPELRKDGPSSSQD